MNSNVFSFKIKISFLSIFFIGLGIRLFYFPFELPLIIDGMDNFTYSTAINYYGHLPTEWTPINNGWPIFVSFWFSIIDLENTLQYMQLQRVISIVLSSLITIPVYFLCKKYFDEKIALVGAALFAFDPRIVLNSLLGITEPLFILLGITSLVFFLTYERRLIFLSFIFASCCTIVRSEGIFLFFTLTILFFIKYKISKEIIKTYFPCVVIFMLILIPIIDYRIEVAGYDGIFQRTVLGTGQIISMTNQNGISEIFNGIELFGKYLGWIMIPNFLIFLPLGIILFLKYRTKDTNFIIIFSIISTMPIFYAYIVQAQDTRYLYFLFPIFSLISLYSVKFYLSKISKKNIALVIMITGILIGSIVVYEYLKNDYEIEKEQNEISKIISKDVIGINFHPSQTQYIRANELPITWPFVFNDNNHVIKIISTENENSLEDYIINSKNNLSHIIVDDHSNLPEFLRNVYNFEEEYEYLDKVYDSKNSDFKHRVKLFKINFDKFDLNIHN
jgi:hypothetical protein